MKAKTKFRPRSIVWSTRLTNSEAKSLRSVAKRSKQNKSSFTRNALLRYIS